MFFCRTLVAWTFKVSCRDLCSKCIVFIMHLCFCLPMKLQVSIHVQMWCSLILLESYLLEYQALRGATFDRLLRLKKASSAHYVDCYFKRWLKGTVGLRVQRGYRLCSQYMCLWRIETAGWVFGYFATKGVVNSLQKISCCCSSTESSLSND